MKSPQERGRDYEKKLAERMGYRTNAGSGNTWYAKGDSRKRSIDGKFLVESKWTEDQGYKFILNNWLVHENLAARYNLEPVFIISFNNKVEIAVIGIYLLEMISELKEEGLPKLIARGGTQFTIKVKDCVGERGSVLPKRFYIDNIGFCILPRDLFEEFRIAYEGN